MVNAKRYADLTGISPEQQKRLFNLFNFSRQQKLIAELNVIRREKLGNIKKQEEYLLMLEKQPDPNKILIHRNKKELTGKKAEYNEIIQEIAKAEQTSIRNKPENLLREIQEIVGPKSKVHTQVRIDFVTITSLRRPRGSDDFELTGVSLAKKQGIHSLNQALRFNIRAIEEAIRKGGEEFLQFRSINIWKHTATIQIVGKSDRVQLATKSGDLVNVLNYMLMNANVNDNSITKFSNLITEKLGYRIYADIRFRYVIFQENDELRERVDDDGDKIYRNVTTRKAFSIPGIEATEIKINGGVPH